MLSISMPMWQNPNAIIRIVSISKGSIAYCDFVVSLYLSTRVVKRLNELKSVSDTCHGNFADFKSVKSLSDGYRSFETEETQVGFLH